MRSIPARRRRLPGSRALPISDIRAAEFIKHAAAARVRVSAVLDEGLIRVCIADDGRGFDTEAPPSGRGLRQLRQRALQLGGEVDIQSSPGAGTSITLKIPVHRGCRDRQVR
jgi:nitrate/nitrite-specific signal transduction histidine kinase